MPGVQPLSLARTNNGFVQLVPGCRVVPQPVPHPSPAAGVGGAADDDPALLGGTLQSPALGTGTEMSYRRNTAQEFTAGEPLERNIWVCVILGNSYIAHIQSVRAFRGNSV